MDATGTIFPYFLYALGILFREGLDALLVIIALLAGPRRLRVDRPAIGGALTHGAHDRRLDVWFDRDTTFLVLAGVAAVRALAVVAVLPSLRPLAAATLRQAS